MSATRHDSRLQLLIRWLTTLVVVCAWNIAGATNVAIVGNVGYQISGSTVILTADEIQNNDSVTSGTLRLELWAFASPYTGASQSGYQLATGTLGTLSSGYYVANTNTGPVSYVKPPDGAWIYTFFLTEYSSDGQFHPVDWVNFSDAMYCSAGVCTNVQNFTLTVSTQGGGTVTSSPNGIICPGTCSANYPANTAIALSAQPSSGYAFSGWSGACAGAGACTVTLSSAASVSATFSAVSATASICPSVGLWAVTAEENGQPGRGLTIEEEAGTLVLTVYGYDSGGKPRFYQSVGTVSNNSFTGSLNQYSGGTTFGGPWQSATQAGTAGQVTINFTDGKSGTITFPGESAKAISKFDWLSGLNAAVSPTLGLWVINAENNGQPGRGFTLEEEGGMLVITVYGYDATGQSTFYQAAGYMSGQSYVNMLSYYSGGMSFGGANKSATLAGQSGYARIAFTDANNGTITFPGESPKAISKFNWGANCTATPSGAPSQAPNVQSATYTLGVLGVTPTVGSGKMTATDPGGYPLSYSIVQAPTAGSATIDAATGVFTYRVPGYVSVAQDQFVVRVSNGTLATTATITMNLPGDPLLRNQWHIQNTGASAFSSILPTPGNDMNVAGAWGQGYSGRGVKVAVVDTGLEVAHEDLAANVDLANSYNYVTGTSDPTPDPNDIGDDHGTQVAGIIGAVAFNGKGGRGVAYNARLRGYSYLQASSLANYSAAMGGQTYSADNDVFNSSFHVSPTHLLPAYGAEALVNGNFTKLRNGLGALVVVAAGNGFSDNSAACSSASALGVSCEDPASDNRRGGSIPIIVGAMNADGIKSSYSTTGASLWVSAPGGEYGFSSSYDTSRAGNTTALQPAIVTTSRTGCQYPNPQDTKIAENALDARGANPLAAYCQYTAMMNGTSSAAPNVSAVIALMLEANPQLSIRDVKYILAKTARKVDPNQSRVSGLVAGAAVDVEQGWVTNAAGFSFSNWYGFGAVDANAAVAMAKTYSTFMPAEASSVAYGWTPASGATIPANSTQGVRITFPVAATFNTIEQVVVFFNLASTPHLTCNQIELTSPAGTKSILMHFGTGFDQYSVSNARMLTNAFYGEPVNGNWVLAFYDFCYPNGTPTVLTSVPQVYFSGR